MKTTLTAQELIQELKSDTHLQADEIQAQLDLLLQNSPHIETPPAFKQQLNEKIQTLIDLKSPQKKNKRLWYFKIAFPIVCSLGFVAGVLHLIDPDISQSPYREYPSEIFIDQDSSTSLSQESLSIQSSFSARSDISQGVILDTKFEQACLARELSISYNEMSIECLKDKKLICTQDTFLKGKCPFLE